MDEETKQSVLDKVDQKAMIDLAFHLIEIPSFKTEETPVAEFLDGYFRERGYEVELQEVEPGRLQTIATLKGSGGGKSLMLNGHTDINSLPRQWTRDPWKPVVDGDRLYGQGVENMKGGLASLITAAEAVRQSGVQLKGDLIVACVVGETQGGEGTYYLVQNGPRPDMAVFPEPTGIGKIATVHSGILHMAIHTYGITAHISMMEGALNAVQEMTKVVQALNDVQFTYTPREDMPAMPRLNVGSIIGGRGESYVLIEPPYVPDLCTIMVDVHFLPGQTVDGIVADIRRVLDRLKAEDPELRYDIEIPPPDFFKGRRRLVMPPIDVPTDEYVVQSVARHHREVTGEAPKGVGTILPFAYSAGDTSHMWAAGIPCVLYGPGGGFGVPSEDEDKFYISISEMVTCAGVLALTAVDICNLESS